MKKKIEIISGIPVEIPILDEEGEKERKLLVDLAMKEYIDTGSFSSAKLQEANAEFIESAKQHLITEENAESEKE